jgi:hypothetical protein
MSDKKISELANNQPLTGSELLPIVQSGTTVKTTIGELSSFGGSGTYNTTLPDSTGSVEVGGIESGTLVSDLKNKPFTEIFDELLFPTIEASITQNISTTLSVVGFQVVGNYAEVGVSGAITFSSTYNDGTITSGDGSTTDVTGPPNLYTFTGTGITVPIEVVSPSTTSSHTWVFGSNTFTGTVDYDAGTTPYYDNKGNIGTNLDASRVAGSISDSETIIGVYPIFYHVSSSPISDVDMETAIENGTAQKIVTDSDGTISIPYNVNNEYFAVAYPNSSTVKTRFYVTDLDQGVITAVFNPVTTRAIDSPDGYWTNINYYIHTSDSALAANPEPIIELRNS